MVTRASRESYSPESSVRTSSSPLALVIREPSRDPLRVRLVVPQVGSRGGVLELGLLLAEPVEVEHRLDVAQRAVELGETVCVVFSGHAFLAYGPFACGAKRSAVRRLLRRRCLEPGERGPVVVGGVLQGRRAELVAVLARLLGLLPRFVHGFGVVFGGLAVDLGELGGGLLSAERHAQRHRVAQRFAAGRLGEPAHERPLAAGVIEYGWLERAPGLPIFT